MLTTEQSLRKLFSRRAWHKNSGINESTARVYKKRFFENSLEMETRMKILEACGYRLIQEMKWEEEINHVQLKVDLLEKLRRENVFWSYDISDISLISDDFLIEKVLFHLDIEDINSLFKIFPVRRIRNIWKDKMLPLEPSYHQLNRLYLLMYFGIKNPDRYIHDFLSNKYKATK